MNIPKAQLILKIFLYASVGFFVYYLYSFDYFIFSSLKVQPFWALLSILLLWSGFVFSTLSWKRSLIVHNVPISNSLAIYSHGISVFAKYIPGKIWVILGRASVVSKQYSSLGKLSNISLKEQLVYLFTGLLISAISLLWIKLPFIYILIVGLTTLGLGLFLFSSLVHRFGERIFMLVFRRELNTPKLSFGDMRPMFVSVLIYWAFWSIGFYVLTLSLFPQTNIAVAFAFPVSVCFGLLAVIMPGGIGVRETILVLFLKSLGMETEEAITISVIQRLWFMSGEIFIFGLALVLKNKSELR